MQIVDSFIEIAKILYDKKDYDRSRKKLEKTIKLIKHIKGNEKLN